MKLFNSPTAHALRTVIAVSTIALLPTLSWQVLDARTSATVAAPVAPVVPVATHHETIVWKSDWTWGHRKSDRMTAPVRIVHQADRSDTSDQAASLAQFAKADREASRMMKTKVDAAQFSDWLVHDEDGTATARIIDFAARKSNINRKSCQARHEAIVSAFSISNARVMADRPVMFQSSICVGNGEIVITCFGTAATISPRRARLGGRCRQLS